jgi:acetyl esterase/lipase
MGRIAMAGAVMAAALPLLGAVSPRRNVRSPGRLRAGELANGSASPGIAISARLPAETRVERDVAYGADPAQRLDVYRPKDGVNAPVIFMVHGGGWTRGDKRSANVVANKAAHWLPKGYVFISTNYRMTDGVTPLDEADDVARALAFAQRHAKSWGADPDRFVVMGHSAGAHLAALLAAAPDIGRRRGVKPWLGTIALDSAAYNVVQVMEGPHLPLYDEVFKTDRALWKAASPTLRLHSRPAPMLLVCSSRRKDSPAQAMGFAARVTALHGRATVLPEDLSHGEINATLGTPGAYTDAVDAFLRSLMPK